MAQVLEQFAISPSEIDIDNNIPKKESVESENSSREFSGEQKALDFFRKNQKLAELPKKIEKILNESQDTTLRGQITHMYDVMESEEFKKEFDGLKYEYDNNGNLTVIAGNARIALALAIFNKTTRDIILFGRKEGEKWYDKNGNSNPKAVDLPVAAKAIASIGSTAFKTGSAFLDQEIEDIQFTGTWAVEITDGDGDAELILMPVYSAQTYADQNNILAACQEERKANTGPDLAASVYSQDQIDTLDPSEMTMKARIALGKV